ncbi:MAG: glycosyltransferase [Clostridiales bacterium]|nr:glycosyltransferase [Clostridiales bacterium]
MAKKKLLVVGITMNCAGTEKSFLSFADSIDYDKYEVDLLLAKKEGLFLDLLPPQIRVIEMDAYGDLFTLTGRSAAAVIRENFCKKNPLVYFELLPYVIKMILFPKQKSFTAMRLWVKMMQKMEVFQGAYDAAIAYWGDKTMFYMIDKVNASKKIAWLHFDYAFPPRDDALYEPYFKQCDGVVTVSESIDKSLKEKLPSIADRCVMMENIQNPRLIRSLAEQGDTFQDDFTGTRVLTIGRISEQKGYDFAVEALSRLKKEGYPIRWYILGGGEERDVAALKQLAADKEVSDCLVLLGVTQNPYGYLKDCDIYAQPSRHEGKPISVEEAKILGKTILISSYLSAAEQLDKGELGLICEIGSEGTYQGLKTLLDHPEICAQYQAELMKRDFGNVHEMNKIYKLLES